jgi:hypothetical protein
MRTSMRVVLLIFVTLGVILGIGFYAQLSWATGLWPWPDSYLSYVFLSSYAVAIAGGVLWVALSGSLGAAKGGLINLGVATAGMAVFGFQAAQTNQAVLPLAIFCSVALLSFVVFYWLIRRAPIQDRRATPLPVRVSFAVFTVVLVAVGVALILNDPTIFPWSLRAETSVIIGWAFLGAACYFLYGALRPRWDNAGGQLLGFLGYDLILIVPFLRHFANVPPGHVLSLIVYVIVLVYSGALAIYYLFINRSTRRWALAPQPAQSLVAKAGE